MAENEHISAEHCLLWSGERFKALAVGSALFLNTEKGKPVMTPSAMGLTLRDMAAPLFRRRRLLAGTFLMVFIAVSSAGIARWSKYEAHMTILVGRQHVGRALSGEVQITRRELKAEADLIRSHDLLQQVVLANGMHSQRRPWFDVLHPGQTEAERVARAVKTLAGEIDIDLPSDANLIEVSYRSPDPALAYGVLNSLGKGFLEKQVQVQSGKAAMEDAEAGLRALLNPDASIDADIPGPQAVLQPPASTPRHRPQTAEKVRESLIANLLAAESKRTQLLEKYEPSHPLVKQANEQIAAIKKAIGQAGQGKDDAQSAGPGASLAVDRRRIESVRAPAGHVVGQSLDETALQREAQADEQDYLRYLDEREQARGANHHDRVGLGQVEIAIPPARPVLPAHSRTFILLLAFVSAAFVSLPITYIFDYFDPSFHTPSQVTELLRVPVVVAVPKRTA
jgi:uncharacterized protein involved in exopolysaccharide biosynthesis